MLPSCASNYEIRGLDEYSGGRSSVEIDQFSGVDELTKNFEKDESGKYVLTRYDEYFKSNDNENKDRPISRDLTIGLDKNRLGQITHKSISFVIPHDLTPENIRLISLYMKLSKQIRLWYEKAAAAKNTTLSQIFKTISDIVDNDNSPKGKNKKAIKNGTFVFQPGHTSSYIDNLQYMFYYIVQQHANKYDGCWAPEVLGMARRELNSIDKTILLWNVQNIEVVDYIEYEYVEELIKRMKTNKLGVDFNFTNKSYDDNSLLKLFQYAKKLHVTIRDLPLEKNKKI